MLEGDRISSATVLARRAETLLREARGRGPVALGEAARQVCAAQPSMASLWNLAAAALDGEPMTFDRLAARIHRAPASVAQITASLLAGDARRVLTCSRSAVVEACIRALHLPVVCAESRPGLEGRALASALAEYSLEAGGPGTRGGAGRRLPVTVVADAAIASDLRPGDVVLVGADAVAPGWFINKTGTNALCAAAQFAGISTYVVTGLDKCISPALADLLRLGEDDPRTLWIDPPPGVRVANPLFERVSLDRVAGVVTEAGVLAGTMVRDACESLLPSRAVGALVALLAQH
jgi:translation initiation factor 2B subunit (eIF-2B alpha/beta/delta family)